LPGLGALAMDDPIDLDRVVNWPPREHNVGSVAHVHAFGQMALTSAMLEELICMLLIQRLPMFPDDATSRVHGLNNRERVEWLRAIISAKEPDATVADLFLHAIRCFDICTENRNMLVHALYEGTDWIAWAIKLSKRVRNNPLRQIKFQVPIEQLRKMAEDMGETVNFMLDLWNCVRTRKAIEEHDPDLPPLPPLTWPDKPIQPDRLTTPPPPATPQNKPRRPRSSRV
jgi:hypothetical protein